MSEEMRFLRADEYQELMRFLERAYGHGRGMFIRSSPRLRVEAEDSSLKQIKQIGSRIDKDGCICVVGDWKQTSGKYLADNGMVQLIEQTKDESLVGVVVLDLDVRSEASKVFAELI